MSNSPCLATLAWIVGLQAICVSARCISADEAPEELRTFSFQVLDPDGQPLPGAALIPWAVRSARGHGLWRPQNDPRRKPPTVVTDDNGLAVVAYPRFRDTDEQIKVTAVTVSVNHPKFVFSGYEDVAVPRATDEPYVVRVKSGGVLELTPLVDGRPAPPEGLHAMVSDSRNMPSAQYTWTNDGAVRLEPMKPGRQCARLALFQGQRITHFSPRVQFVSAPGETVSGTVELKPAVRLLGKFSDDVPRPVRHGCVVAGSLNMSDEIDGSTWLSFTRVAADGSFVIESWPADDPVQLIALCDGFRAASGSPPFPIKDESQPDRFLRPQVFHPQQFEQSLTIAMTPLMPCEFLVVDHAGLPVVGAEVGSYPNVGWWNNGSNVYCDRHLTGEQLLLSNDWSAEEAADPGKDALPRPFLTTTDADGRARLELPEGRQYVYLKSETYELPIVAGERERRLIVLPDTPVSMRLVVQPKGTELQGDWDKLSGVLFGCTGPECRNNMDNPIFAAEMTAAGKEIEAAKDPTSPALLSGVYQRFANAFTAINDIEEAAKWRHKAAQQQEKLKPDVKP